MTAASLIAANPFPLGESGASCAARVADGGSPLRREPPLSLRLAFATFPPLHGGNVVARQRQTSGPRWDDHLHALEAVHEGRVAAHGLADHFDLREALQDLFPDDRQ